MNQFKISHRLILLVLTFSVMLLAGAGMGLYGISKANEALNSVYVDRTVPLGQLANMGRVTTRNAALIASAANEPVSEKVALKLAEIEQNSAQGDKTWADYMATKLTAEEEKLAANFVEVRTTYLKEAIQPAVKALKTDDIANAQRIANEVLEPLYQKVQGALTPLLNIQLKVAKQEYDAAVERYNLIFNLAVGSLAIGLPLAAFFAFVLIRNLSRSLDDASRLARAVAQGDLTRTIRVEGKDEMAALMTALRDMNESLVKVVSGVRQGAGGVACHRPAYRIHSMIGI